MNNIKKTIDLLTSQFDCIWVKPDEIEKFEKQVYELGYGIIGDMEWNGEQASREDGGGSCYFWHNKGTVKKIASRIAKEACEGAKSNVFTLPSERYFKFIFHNASSEYIKNVRKHGIYPDDYFLDAGGILISDSHQEGWQEVKMENNKWVKV